MLPPKSASVWVPASMAALAASHLPHCQPQPLSVPHGIQRESLVTPRDRLQVNCSPPPVMYCPVSEASPMALARASCSFSVRVTLRD